MRTIILLSAILISSSIQPLNVTFTNIEALVIWAILISSAVAELIKEISGLSRKVN